MIDFSCKTFRWLVGGLLLALALPVAAQQAIIISKPAEKANANLPTAAQRRGLGAFNAPQSIFGGAPEAAFDNLPGATVINNVSPEAARQWKKALDAKKNWTLMTPAEIMGVSTPEKILGLMDQKADDKLSPEERYLIRQDRAASLATGLAATNSLRRSDAALAPQDDDNPFVPRNDATRDARFSNERSAAASTRNFSRLFNPQPDAGIVAKPSADLPWGNVFGRPPAMTDKAVVEQAAVMDRFRVMMEPGSAPDLSPAAAARPTAPVLPLPNPNLNREFVENPLGHSFIPIQNNVGRPAGVTPLPSITGPYKSATPVKSAPLVQLPPWLSATPQPFGMQQRQF